MKNKLPEEYIDSGFKLARVDGKFFALKHQDKVIFVLGSGLDLSNDFLKRLCKSYLYVAANASRN